MQNSGRIQPTDSLKVPGDFSWLSRAVAAAHVSALAVNWVSPPSLIPNQAVGLSGSPTSSCSPPWAGDALTPQTRKRHEEEEPDLPALEDGDSAETDDVKKLKRLVSNRASAKRSRLRKQERLNELELLSAKLRIENAASARKLAEVEDQLRRYQEENTALRGKLDKLQNKMGETSYGRSSNVGDNQEACTSDWHQQAVSNGSQFQQGSHSEGVIANPQEGEKVGVRGSCCYRRVSTDTARFSCSISATAPSLTGQTEAGSSLAEQHDEVLQLLREVDAQARVIDERGNGKESDHQRLEQQRQADALFAVFMEDCLSADALPGIHMEI